MLSLGRHIIAELYNCDVEKINDVSFVESAMLGAAQTAGATVINSTFHHFSPFGVSGVIVIQESHFSIHCWPEYRYASIDIYTCGDTVNPWMAYEHLKSNLGASHGSTLELSRGQRHLMGSEYDSKFSEIQSRKGQVTEIKQTRNIWFTQRNENLALSLRHTGDRLYSFQSEFQKIDIYKTEAFGKILVLDGKIVCAEADEYVYHEMIAHVPVFAHPKPEKILVIGGGDGGTVRELVKHHQIKSIDLVEIDKHVIEASRKFMPELSKSIDHQKVNLILADGVDFIAKCAPDSYDIVIIDSDDPEGPGVGLFTEAFYKNVRKTLKDPGIMITQSESPRYNADIFREIYSKYHRIFGKENVFCYLMYLPSFPSGMWSFSFSATGEITPLKKTTDIRIKKFCEENELKYYDTRIHEAAFALPKFVSNILSGK